MSKFKKEVIFLSIVILIYIGYTTYIYLRPKNISPNSLIEISGLLLEQPGYEETNGDNASNISFQLIGDTRKFKIESCGVKAIDLEVMTNLKSRDSVTFKVKEKHHRNLRESINSRIEVFELRISSTETILSLDNYNKCEKSVWKEIFLVTVLLVLALVFTFIDRIFHKPVPRNNKG
ncbi:MAG: hypothetical protein AAFX87_30370 [Bacteroidota bacterium]